MDELRDLSQIFNTAAERFSQYKGKDFVLPQVFKDQVKEINSNTITYNKYSAIIETRGTQNGVLNIYLPNQWFYIASYFTDFYNELMRYKKEALKVASKERLKILNGLELNEAELNLLNTLSLNDTSKDYLKKFITEYTWWNGAKTIDRGDFYVSPILSSAKLVNASQSFVADLCAFLADKTDLVKAIISGVDSFDGTHGFDERDKDSLQQIFYGAPGTGKSHKIQEKTVTAENEGRVIRTTFHPDSDYSTFVGAYKPSMRHGEKVYTPEELVIKLNEIKNTGVTYPCQKFGAKYWRSLKDLSAEKIKQILNACQFTDSMTTEISKAIAIGQDYLNKSEDGKIVYTFVPQAFTKAYVQAWNTNDDVFLIIEEINRGNCAQIFGDLFQLLDRKNGYSEYPIHADVDLSNYIGKALAGSPRTDIPSEVKEGTLLVLPSNLYIWATMNTSDQSLFPIDSAFKRRWDWKYIPINPEKENWSIETSKGLFSWSSFLNEINREIGETTSSEDKKLGFYFCKAESDKISAEKFVSKVLFYVYNDVFKDYGFESKDFFKKNGKVMYFQDYYNLDGTINEENVIQFLNNLKIEKTSESNNQS